MIIDTGAKAFWLSAFIFYWLAEGGFGILCGITQKEKEPRFSIWDSVQYGILCIICVGWWFGS